MEHVTKVLSRLSSVLTKYIGMIIICFSVIAFFWRDGFAWTTNYTSIFLALHVRHGTDYSYRRF